MMKNDNKQIVVRETEKKFLNHPNAKIWEMRCDHCGHMYGANGCDWQIRKCPAAKVHNLVFVFN